MTQTNLTTAKYYQEVEEAEVPSPAVPRAVVPDEFPSPKHGPPASSAERIVRWFSLTMAVAVIICVAVVAVPYVASVSSHTPKNPIDWWLRLGGAEQDQTFEKFVKNVATKNQFDWEEQFKKSPVYGMDMGQFDVSKLQVSPMQGFPVSSTRKKK